MIRGRVVAVMWISGLLLAAWTQQSSAQAQAQPRTEETLDEVVVSGEQPGPGLWKVTNGANTLWVLGTYTPLPRDMKWRAREVESVIARSQTVIAPAEVEAGIGFFTGVRLLPTLLRARAIPDDGTLAEVLQPALYSRWAVLAKRYSLPDKVERWRPVLAGFVLRDEAMDAAHLSDREIAWPVVEKLAKRHDVMIRRPTVALDIKDPKGLIKDYTRINVSAEADCLETIVVQIEHGIPQLQSLANAWATGDVAALRNVETDPAEARCRDALMGSSRLGSEIKEAQRRYRQEILLAWEGALQRDGNALALAAVDELVARDGLLQELRDRGYVVSEPGVTGP